MIWVIVIIILGIIIYDWFTSPHKGKQSIKYTQSSSQSNNNIQIPSRLIGISPNINSFWNTAEFFVRLGEECAKKSDNNFVCSFFIRPDGEFSCMFYDIDSAKEFFPSLEKNLNGSLMEPISKSHILCTQRRKYVK